MTPAPDALAGIALEAAREAAALVMQGFRSRPAATEKARRDLVTEYDLASERLIRARLEQHMPGVAVFAEEEGGRRAAGPVAYVDPLDGTTNFVHGHPFWAVSIGVLDGDVPLAGAVVAPALALTWTAWRGGPALRNGQPCGVSATGRLAEALVATGFPPERDTPPHDNFASFVAVKRRARGVRRCGSAAIDMCFVGDGTYDGYWERKLNVWDLAAGAAVVSCAGGRITALDGAEPRWAVGHVVASNGSIHDELLSVLDDSRTSSHSGA